MPRIPMPPSLSEKDNALLLFGRAMAAWANLEKGFYVWFEHITLLEPQHAQPLYFAPTGFKGRADLLRSVIQSYALEKDELAFIDKALGLGIHYSSFRNKLAHGEFTFHGLVVEPKHADRASAMMSAIKSEHLYLASSAFQGLANILYTAREIALGFVPEDEPDASLAICLQQVNELPRLEWPPKNNRE
jgi:hypothetical protein